MRRTALAPSLLSLLACSGLLPAKPASLAFDPTPAQIVDDLNYPLNARLLDDKGAVMSGQAINYVVTPADVALVTSNGDVHCTRAGDASLTMNGGGLSQTTNVACRVVATIEAPAPGRVVIGRPATFTPEAKDASGGTLADVPVGVSSSDEDVISVRKGRLEAMTVGRANLTLTAGKVAVTLPVETARAVFTDSVALKDGEGLTWALPAGTYEVEVQAKAVDGSEHGVTLTWTGTDCPAGAEAQAMRTNCTVKDAASLLVQNPTRLGRGADAAGFINVYEIPSP